MGPIMAGVSVVEGATDMPGTELSFMGPGFGLLEVCDEDVQEAGVIITFASSKDETIASFLETTEDCVNSGDAWDVRV